MIGVIVDQLKGEVCTGVQRGDFSSWMSAEQRRIFLLCRRLLKDPEEADSATQDVFLKAYKALRKNGAEASELDSPGKWLTRIAVNTCLDRLRSNAWKVWHRRPAPEAEDIILQMASVTEPNAESLLFAKQIQQRLALALSKLSERQRIVFSLRHYEAMPLDEIAAALKLDSGTVKAHLFRALTKLREELKDLYLDGGRGVRKEV